MKNKFSNNGAVLYIVIGLILGWLITSLFLAPSWTGSPINFGSMMGFQSNNVTNIDRHFIEQMIPHHEDAITMAKVALERAKRPEIKSLAQSILTNQNTEITQMTMWYAEWYGQMADKMISVLQNIKQVDVATKIINDFYDNFESLVDEKPIIGFSVV